MPILTVSLTNIPEAFRAWPMLKSKQSRLSGDCLSASTIYHTTQGRKHGFELQLGDRVLVNNGVYAPIVLLQRGSLTRLVQFTLEDGTVLSCTPSHFLYTNTTSCVPANDIHDTLCASDGTLLKIVAKEIVYDDIVQPITYHSTNQLLVSDAKIKASIFSQCKCSDCKYVSSAIQFQYFMHPHLGTQTVLKEAQRLYGNDYKKSDAYLRKKIQEHFHPYRQHQKRTLEDDLSSPQTSSSLLLLAH